MSVTNVKSNWEGGNLVFRDKSGTIITTLDGTNALAITPGEVRHVQTRFTVAQVNAGATLIAAIPGYKIRMVDFTMIAIGGNAATATSVDIGATQTTAALLAVVAVAALTRSAAVKPNSANVTLLADGLSHVANDANTAITIAKAGGTLATATHIDLAFSYVLEAA